MENTNKKEIITGFRVNLESVYYAVLFTLGAIAASVLTYIGNSKNNKGLVTYSAILIPIFAICALVAIRFALVSKNTIYKKSYMLVMKTFFFTFRIPIYEIERLTAAQNGATGITSVNLTYRGKTVNFEFKKISKEEVAHLRRAAYAK